MAVTTDDFDGTGVTNSSAGSTLIDHRATGPVALAVDQQTLVGDANYQMLPTDRYVVTSVAFTAPRVWTLPAANSVSVGKLITVADAVNYINITNTLSVTPAGGDTVGGLPFSAVMNRSAGFVTLRSDGTSNWVLIGFSPDVAGVATPYDSLAGFLAVQHAVFLSGADVGLANGRNDNIGVGNSCLRSANPTAAHSISGIVPTKTSVSSAFTAGDDGQYLTIENATAFPMSILHQNSFSTAANRIITPTAASVAVQGGGSCQLIYDGSQSRWILQNAFSTAKPQSLREWFSQTGLPETFPRGSTAAVNTVAALTSGTLYCVAIELPNNLLVTNINFISGATAAGTPTNWWFALLDGSRNIVGQTADQTTTAWAANTLKTLALTTPYTTTTEATYYLAVMVKATTVPTLTGFVTTANLTSAVGFALKREGNSTTGLTTPASLSTPTTAITTTGNIAYGYVS